MRIYQKRPLSFYCMSASSKDSSETALIDFKENIFTISGQITLSKYCSSLSKEVSVLKEKNSLPFRVDLFLEGA